jgi:hypothetical protein
VEESGWDVTTEKSPDARERDQAPTSVLAYAPPVAGDSGVSALRLARSAAIVHSSVCGLTGACLGVAIDALIILPLGASLGLSSPLMTGTAVIVAIVLLQAFARLAYVETFRATLRSYTDL